MINLLPPKQKTRLLQQRNLRLVLILEILFVSFLVSLFLVLLLVKSYILSDLETNKVILEEKKGIIARNQDKEKEIRESNNLLSDLVSFYQKEINLTQVLEKIEEILPSHTYLTELNLDFRDIGGEKKARFSLSGYCSTRDNLLVLKDRLEENFEEVSFSPSSWVKPNDVKFSVNFELK